MNLTIPFAVTLPARTAFRVLGCSLLLIAVACIPRTVWADCTLNGGGAPTVNFNAQTVTLTINSQPSTTTPIWQSGIITPPGNTTISCGSTTGSGITMSIAGPPTGSDNTLFPTNIPGISYRLLHIASPVQYTMPSYPNYTLTPRSDSPLSGTTQMFLYYTGPYLPPSGGTMVGPLSQWQTDIRTCTGKGKNRVCTTSQQAIEYFTVNVKITVSVPTCNVGTSANGGPSNFTFTLPSVTTEQLAVNPTPGLTPINLPLVNCPTGQKVFITLSTSAPYTTGGVNGVIAPSGAGYAAGVGVQLLQANSTTPVTFRTAFGGPAIGGTGVATGSNFTINLFARYYKTAATVTAGPVQGVATYTLNYQ